MIRLLPFVLVGNPLYTFEEENGAPKLSFNHAPAGKLIAFFPPWKPVLKSYRDLVMARARNEADLGEKLLDHCPVEGSLSKREIAPFSLERFTFGRAYDRPLSLQEALERKWLARTTYQGYARMTHAPQEFRALVDIMYANTQEPYYVTILGSASDIGLSRFSEGMKRRKTDWKELLATSLGIVRPAIVR